MKFLKSNKIEYIQKPYEKFFLSDLSYLYENYDFDKNLIKNRKNLTKIKSGIALNIKKNSIFRDKNISLINQFINLNQKRGKKINFNKHLNKSFENLFFVFSHNIKDFDMYTRYSDFVFLHNNNFLFTRPNFILDFIVNGLESIFEIKTIKNNKKLKLPSKYTHEIVYIPRERRLKYVLRSLSFYKENFKNYNIWERLFWSFFITIVNKNKSFLKKKQEYIYLKSIKFFKNKK